MVGCSSKRKLKPKGRKRNTKKNKIIDYVPEDTESNNVIDHLSKDIWFEIITHLPLKQNFQLKLVSKQWYALISSNNFMTRKLNICTFYYEVRSENQPLINCQSIPIIFSLNAASSDHSASDDEYIHDGFSLKFLPKNMQKRLFLLGSNNGLLLCRYSPWRGQYHFFICNPLTRKWREVYCLVSDRYAEHDSYVLICESPFSTWNTNPTDFKVVRIPHIVTPTKKFYVGIFSSDTGYWRYYKVLCSDKITMKNKKKIVSDKNGCLYWIIESNKILTYDPKKYATANTGKCILIDLPKNDEDDDHGSPSVAQSCIAESEGFIFFIRIESRQMNVGVWLLQKEKDNEQRSWKIVHKIKLNEMLAGYDWNNTRLMNMKPLGFSPMDRNIVFIQSDEYILQYNILTRRSQLLSLSSHLDGPISSYEFGVLPFIMTTKTTRIPVTKLSCGYI